MSEVKNRFGIILRGGLSALLALFAFSALPAAAQNSFVVADFNGDQKPDLVTLAGAPGSVPGIRATLFDDGALAQVNRFPHQVLRVRDLDGDSDRDIVVETGSAVAVWLNDGAGNFTRGHPEDFELQPHTEDSQSFDPSHKAPLPEITDESPRAGVVAPPDFTGTVLTGPLAIHSAPAVPPAAVLPGLRTRGPPSRNS